MRNLADTINRLQRYQTPASPTRSFGFSPLKSLTNFGSNPGALQALAFVPAQLQAHAPLVVVLHGCTQTAQVYDHGSGWSALAEEQGFAVLFPEQVRSNNPNTCFNWFSPGDSRRGGGEPLSIIQMIETMVAQHKLDAKRVYITGLSAGGAMASVMLATYPEAFAGGAIIAGLPYGCAQTIPEAFDRMRGHGGPSQAQLPQLVREAAQHDGSWPTISVWHGSADAVVHPSNAAAIVDQWKSIHDVHDETPITQTVDGAPRRVWLTAAGREVIEEFRIEGMGHGTPRGPGDAGGSSAYMLEANISSSRHIARFWGLTNAATSTRFETSQPSNDPASKRAAQMPTPVSGAGGQLTRSEALDLHSRTSPQPTSPVDRVKKVIEDALRGAGLMK